MKTEETQFQFCPIYLTTQDKIAIAIIKKYMAKGLKLNEIIEIGTHAMDTEEKEVTETKLKYLYKRYIQDDQDEEYFLTPRKNLNNSKG